jgi:DNA oxidative demethylase
VNGELFYGLDDEPRVAGIGPGASWLRGFVAADDAVLDAIEAVCVRAPPRRMTPPGGRRMSVAMTNCGPAGWVSDLYGYRYTAADPVSGRPWPAMPELLRELATSAAAVAGFTRFERDACLINCYAPGTRLSLHQDRDERDLAAPIVSVSLGLPATFLFGGPKRTGKLQRLRLEHRDIVVWGGESRLHYHGVAPLADGLHAKVGARRVNLTFRKSL